MTTADVGRIMGAKTPTSADGSWGASSTAPASPPVRATTPPAIAGANQTDVPRKPDGVAGAPTDPGTNASGTTSSSTKDASEGGGGGDDSDGSTLVTVLVILGILAAIAFVVAVVVVHRRKADDDRVLASLTDSRKMTLAARTASTRRPTQQTTHNATFEFEDADHGTSGPVALQRKVDYVGEEGGGGHAPSLYAVPLTTAGQWH